MHRFRFEALQLLLQFEYTLEQVNQSTTLYLNESLEHPETSILNWCELLHQHNTNVWHPELLYFCLASN